MSEIFRPEHADQQSEQAEHPRLSGGPERQQQQGQGDGNGHKSQPAGLDQQQNNCLTKRRPVTAGVLYNKPCDTYR